MLNADGRSIRCCFEPLFACRKVLNESLVVDLRRLDVSNWQQIRHEMGRERVAWVTGGHVERVNHVKRWLRRQPCVHVTRLLEDNRNPIQRPRPLQRLHRSFLRPNRARTIFMHAV